MTVEAIAPEDGALVYSAQETAESPSAMVPAIRRLATRFRLGAGEQQSSVAMTSRTLQKATTPSLEALRLYSEAYEAGSRELWAQSESLVRSALELEPDFPSALNWMGWSLVRLGKPKAESLPYFERASALADRTQDRERYFILGSYYAQSGDQARALAAYETLVRLYPDHTWGVNNLIISLHDAGRRLESSDLLADLVRARKDDTELMVWAAAEALAAKGIEAARPLVAQARSLVSQRPSGTAHRSLWLELFEAHESWLAGRPDNARRQLDAAMKSQTVANASPDVRNTAEGWFQLALGRLRDAEAAFQLVASAPLRTVGLAAVALARGEGQEVSRHLADYRGPDAIAALLLAKADDHVTARRVFERIHRAAVRPTGPAWDAIRAEVETASPAEQRMRIIRRAVTEVPVGWDTARYSLHVETIASYLSGTGQGKEAIALLEQAAKYRDRTHRDPVHIGYFWMGVQKRLADAYRADGRISEAEQIERDLLRVLGSADPDFSMLVDLQARLPAAASR